MNKILIFCFLVLLLSSCSDSFQYDVYISNQTGQTIRIEYRTNNAKNGVAQNSIVLKNGARQLLISTGEIAKYEDQPMNDRAYCAKVATYIRAFSESGEPIDKNWCDDNLKIDRVDIGQAEYLITYSEEDL